MHEFSLMTQPLVCVFFVLKLHNTVLTGNKTNRLYWDLFQESMFRTVTSSFPSSELSDGKVVGLGIK